MRNEQSSRAVPETGVDSGVASASVRPEPIDVAAWRNAMEGVTPGLWSAGASHDGASVVDADDAMERVCRIEVWSPEQDTLDAAWIARCSPAGISTLLDALDAKDHELAEARKHVRQLQDFNSRRELDILEIASQRDDAMAVLREKEDRVKALEEALGKVEHWAESRCPCHNEEPNPCPLCGASVENLEACKSAESTLPREVLEAIRSVSHRARTVLSSVQPVSGSREQRGNEEG